MGQVQSKATPASEFCRNFGRYKDAAIERGVIEVSSNGRAVGAYLSQTEYERFLTLKQRETRVHKIDELPDDILNDIETAQYDQISE